MLRAVRNMWARFTHTDGVVNYNLRSARAVHTTWKGTPHCPYVDSTQAMKVNELFNLLQELMNNNEQEYTFVDDLGRGVVALEVDRKAQTIAFGLLEPYTASEDIYD
jgi:hypothetical protein